jgi:Protein of unknown function (DUF4231)
MQLQDDRAEVYLNGRWQQQCNYYSKRAISNKRWHQNLLLFSTISALVVPVLLNIVEIPKWVPTLLSVLVSVALTLDNVYHFGDNWRSFRQTLEALKRERILFETKSGSYEESETAFRLFVQRCEEIMQAEGKNYFERQKARKPDKGA